MTTVVELLGELSKREPVELTEEIRTHLLEIKGICKEKYSWRGQHGNAALNRMMLLDPNIAFHLTPEVLTYL